MSDLKNHCIIVVSLDLLRRTAANTTEYFDEAWVAIYNATDGEPKTSNLVGKLPDFYRYLGYSETCNGKAAINLNSQHHDWSSNFLFTLTDTEISENLRCV